MHKKNNNLNIHNKIIAWAKKILTITDDKVFIDSNIIIKTPWSTVLKINIFYKNINKNKFVYLKQTPKQLALEADIINILYNKFNIAVPRIIKSNKKLNCFLMHDAGITLREILRQKFDITLLFKSIDRFIAMQLAVINHLDIFINLGVPDWRLDKLPDLYQKLMLNKKLLITARLSKIEINKLKNLYPQIINLSQKLSSYNIKQTIVQPDFSDNNLLINNLSKKITIIDLGEIVISHPFFSLINFLQQIKKHYNITENSKIYRKIKIAYFKNYRAFESKKNLLDIFKLAEKLYLVYGVLAYVRLIDACNKSKLPASKLSSLLRELFKL